MVVINHLSAPTITTPIPLELLTPSSFAPFGTVITTPTNPGIPANQGSARKHPSISPLTNSYPSASSPRINLFVCSPRVLSLAGVFSSDILERHPYTTQTFVPLSVSDDADAEDYYVVIVAPTGKDGMPELGGLRAFKADGGRALTYAAGTWHAPMVVVGRNDIRFVVVQSESGVAREDCEEVTFEPGVPVQAGI